METRIPCRPTRGSLTSPSYLARNRTLGPPLERWCSAYREGGPDALLPKPKGRPRKPGKPAYASREEELEARVRELELELEIQKRINALADGLEPR